MLTATAVTVVAVVLFLTIQTVQPVVEADVYCVFTTTLDVDTQEVATIGAEGIVTPQDTFPEVAVPETGVISTEPPLTKFALGAVKSPETIKSVSHLQKLEVLL